MQALSTAWEVIKAGGAHTVVARMLVSDAETRAESLDTSSGDNRLGVLRSAAVTGLALAAVAVFVPVPGRPTASTAAVAAGNGEAPLTEDQVATLADVARLLDLSAEQSGDQYLRAIAASFAELATEATSGDLTRAGADRAVRDLLAHLGTAVSGSGGGLASAVEHALAQVPATAASGSPLAGADNASNGQLKTAQTEDAEAAVETATPDDSASLYMALRSLVDELEDGGGASLRPTGPAADGQTIDDSFYGGVGRAQADPNAAAPAGPLVRAEGAGDPAGAAQRSTEGAGDAAGAGAAALPEMFDPVAAVQAAAVAESLLPRNESTEGRRVEIEMVPQAEERPSDDEAPVLAPDFVRSREAAIVARGVGAEHGDVVGRYFTPDSSSGDGAP